MITGLHAIVHANDADKVRTFLRDMLGLKSVGECAQGKSE